MATNAFIGYHQSDESLTGFGVEVGGTPDYLSPWFATLRDQEAGVERVEAMLEEGGGGWYEVYVDQEGVATGEPAEDLIPRITSPSMEALTAPAGKPFAYVYVLNDDEVSIYAAGDYVGALFYRVGA